MVDRCPYHLKIVYRYIKIIAQLICDNHYII